MPLPPVHMGPGVAIKAAMRGRFSLMVFGWSQVAIDLQPLVVLLTHKGELHGFSHTFLGATLIGLVCGLTGKPLGEFGLRLLRADRYLPIGWGVSFGSAFIGTYSHILIDSIMHWDVLPRLPFGIRNPLYGVLGMGALHLVCLGCAVIGGVVLYVSREKWRRG